MTAAGKVLAAFLLGTFQSRSALLAGVVVRWRWPEWSLVLVVVAVEGQRDDV